MNRNQVNFLRHRIKKKIPAFVSVSSRSNKTKSSRLFLQGLAVLTILLGSVQVFQKRNLIRFGFQNMSAITQMKWDGVDSIVSGPVPVKQESLDSEGDRIQSFSTVEAVQELAPNMEQTESGIQDKSQDSVVAKPTDPDQNQESMSKEELAMLQDLKAKNIKGIETVKKDQKGDVTLVLNTDQFFQSGTARINGEKVTQLTEIADALKASAQNLANAALEIESHTDDSPIVKQKHLYQSNWELSAARAASLVHVFEEVGFNKDQMKLVGYGDSRPVVPNRDPNGEPIARNAMKNRRIVLRVFQANSEKGSI